MLTFDPINSSMNYQFTLTHMKLWTYFSMSKNFLTAETRLDLNIYHAVWPRRVSKCFSSSSGTFLQTQVLEKEEFHLTFPSVRWLTAIQTLISLIYLCIQPRLPFPCSSDNQFHTHVVRGLRVCHPGGADFRFPVSWPFPLPAVLLLWLRLQPVRTLQGPEKKKKKFVKRGGGDSKSSSEDSRGRWR